MIVLNVIGLSWLVTHYKEFSGWIKDILSKPKVIFNIPSKIISCLMCCSFWVGLILTNGDIPLSGFISLVAFCIDKYLISTPIKL